MQDAYPRYEAIPPEWLVDADQQPDYRGSDPRAARSVAAAILGAGSDATAVIHHESGAHLTYTELDRQSARLARALLGLGARPGDRVAVRCANRPEWIVAALAVWRSGAVVVPIPMQARAEELNHLLRDTAARFLLTQDDPDGRSEVAGGVVDTDVAHVISGGWDQVPAADDLDLPDVDPDSVAIVWHTGGTTGRPKGCYHTHRRFLLAGYSIGAATGIGPGERWAASAQIGHALGFIYHTSYTLLHGATVVLVEAFQQADVVLRAIADHGVTTFTAITATWAQLQKALVADPELPMPPATLRGYAMWQSASASEVYEWWLARGIALRNNFGSTSFATWVLVPRGEHTRASLGSAAPGYEVIAIEPDATDILPVPVNTPGRMAVRGPSGLTYWRRPDLQRRDVREGWTLVDDMIQIGADGNTTYLGRTDYLISTAGYKVAPVEVETVLATHPAVREVAVLGKPDAVRQEVVCAFVAVADGVPADDKLRRELQEYVKSRMAPYKYPRVVEFVDRLPRDPIGKVIQRVLRDTMSTMDSATPAGQS